VEFTGRHGKRVWDRLAIVERPRRLQHRDRALSTDARRLEIRIPLREVLDRRIGPAVADDVELRLADAIRRRRRLIPERAPRNERRMVVANSVCVMPSGLKMRSAAKSRSDFPLARFTTIDSST
jgi:hypothetical protein